MKKKIKTINNGAKVEIGTIIYILFISLFIFNPLVRGIFINNNLSKINIVAIFMLMILFIFSRKINKSLLIYIGFLLIIVIRSELINYKSIKSLIIVLSTLIIPIFILTIRVDVSEVQKLLKLFLKIFNKVIIIIIIVGLIDFITKGYIANVMAQIYNDESYKTLVSDIVQGRISYRYYSFMGHPLYNTQLYLMFYTMNVLYNKYFGEYYKYYVIPIITIIGISLTASKTGFILLIVCIIFLQNSNNAFTGKIKVAVVFILSLVSGIFDNVILRFINTDLTSGRFKMLEIVNSSGYFPMKFWNGYGSEYIFVMNSIIPWSSAAYEFPILLFPLEYGMLFTIILYSIIAIYPLILFIKRKQKSILIAYLVVAIDVNTYNGLGLMGDYMLIWCVFHWLLINLSNYVYRYKKE